MKSTILSLLCVGPSSLYHYNTTVILSYRSEPTLILRVKTLVSIIEFSGMSKFNKNWLSLTRDIRIYESRIADWNL